MFNRTKSRYPQVVILIATGFDERGTTECLSTMRRAGLATELVGLTSGLVTGANGLAVRPDRSLVDLDETAALRLVILPGQTRSATALLADPRVHRLFATAAANGGRLAVMNQAEHALARAGLVQLLSDPSVVGQGPKDVTTFTRCLTNMMAA